MHQLKAILPESKKQENIIMKMDTDQQILVKISAKFLQVSQRLKQEVVFVYALRDQFLQNIQRFMRN